MKKILTIVAAVLVLLSSCAIAAPAPTTVPATQPESTAPPTTEPPAEPDPLEAMLQQMTLREKVGQLFIIRADALDLTQTPEQIIAPSADGVTELSEEMEAVLKAYPVGGIALFRKNIVDEQQLETLIGALQSTGKIPLFMAVDEEGGLVARLANHPSFDLPKYASAAAVGKSGASGDALAMGTNIGAYLYRYGFNMDFAPVADVNTNPNNPIIGNRAFSSDAATASEMAKAMAEGLKEKNIIPVFKHFPGHGDTKEDSHGGIAVSYKTKEEMAACEWLPYEGLTDGDCVMIGHIAAPNITGDLTPATLSGAIVTDVLRGQLGFEGLVITDSLAMGAITEKYTSGEAAVGALKAGCDILLGPEVLQEAFDAVVAAVEDGTISEDMLNERVYRILQLKEKYGLLN